jgi:hypothetical protein
MLCSVWFAWSAMLISATEYTEPKVSPPPQCRCRTRAISYSTSMIILLHHLHLSSFPPLLCLLYGTLPESYTGSRSVQSDNLVRFTSSSCKLSQANEEGDSRGAKRSGTKRELIGNKEGSRGAVIRIDRVGTPDQRGGPAGENTSQLLSAEISEACRGQIPRLEGRGWHYIQPLRWSRLFPAE